MLIRRNQESVAMAELDEIQFACIGCGTMNPPGAEVCAGCGHRFASLEFTTLAKPAFIPKSRPAPFDPYDPPQSPIAPPRTFRIGTGLALIAVIAVCLAAWRAQPVAGIAVSVLVLVAAVRTPVLASRRRAEGRPMSLGDQIGSFVMTVLATIGVVTASGIAFCATCFPSTIATNNVVVGLGFGAVGAVTSAVLMTRLFARVARENAARGSEIRYR